MYLKVIDRIMYKHFKGFTARFRNLLLKQSSLNLKSGRLQQKYKQRVLKKVFDRNSRAQDRIKYKDILFYSFSLYINRPFKKNTHYFKVNRKKVTMI